MPRKARVEFPGAVYHLLDRGDRREAIFRDDNCRDFSTDPFCSSPATATATATPTATATATATPTAPAAAAPSATATATATPASQVSTPAFNPDGGTWLITQQRSVTVTTSTTGANMRYTINGAPPTSTTGTLISGPVNVTPSPGGTTLRVIAYKAGMIDSQVHEAVFYYENDNGGNTNMAQPIDGGPGGGGILIDGGNQPTISYDDNGNLIHYKEWNYRYDAQNRLTQAWNGTTTAVFYYDGKNRQIARNINGVIRFSSWDNWELVEEYSSSLNVTTGYLQGTTGVIKSWSAANTLYYYQDKLGSTTHVANASGQLVESYKYDLYGTPSYFNALNTQLSTSNYVVSDLYAGERWIPELALYDLRNRFMSPELGRLLQPDPLGLQTQGEKLTAGQKAYFFNSYQSFAGTARGSYSESRDRDINRSATCDVDRKDMDRSPLEDALSRTTIFGARWMANRVLSLCSTLGDSLWPAVESVKGSAERADGYWNCAV